MYWQEIQRLLREAVRRWPPQQTGEGQTPPAGWDGQTATANAPVLSEQRFVTIAGRQDYRVFGERIEEVRISGRDYDVRLPRVDPYEFFHRPNTGSGPPAAYCIVGETLHLYPVPDREYTIGYRANAEGVPNDPAEGLFVRWMEDYRAVEDQVYTRVSVSTRELPMPRWATPVDEARRQFFLQRYHGQYEEMCRRAREVPGETFHCEVVITVQELALGLLYAPTLLTRQIDAGREARESLERARAVVSERERCEKRSMELLRDWLSPEQRKELALEHYFTITGEHSGKQYQIHKVYSFGLKELDEAGNVVASYCVVPAGTHALGDTMLAQKVWMETDERATLERANRMSALGANVMLGAAGQQMLAGAAQGGLYQAGLAQQTMTAEAMAQLGMHPADVARVREQESREEQRQRQQQQILSNDRYLTLEEYAARAGT